jgi:hypothetical protein
LEVVGNVFEGLVELGGIVLKVNIFGLPLEFTRLVAC